MTPAKLLALRASIIAASTPAPAPRVTPKKSKPAKLPCAAPGPLFWWEGPALHVTLRIKTQNEGNHVADRVVIADRRRKTRNAVRAHLSNCPPVVLPIDVTLTRFSANALDRNGGIHSALKSVMDEIADWLPLPKNRNGHADDSDPRVDWMVGQKPSPRGSTWVEVVFIPRKT